jgi:hypothetical protein
LMSFLETSTFDIFACYWVAMTPPMKRQILGRIMCYPTHHPW